VLELTPKESPVRSRTRRDPNPRFRTDASSQLDAALGCPELQVPAEHMARRVRELVERMDTSAVESRYSSLGRRGYHPKRLLALWVYASIVGLHHATKLARALATDAALRLLSGGHNISRPVLNRFRQENAELFARGIEETVRLAHELGMVPLEDLAVDSVRLRAHASMTKVRTKKRSTERLRELAQVDFSALSEAKRAKHEESLAKHQLALKLCDERKTSSVVLTAPSAALMKFPSGLALAGHRVTATVAGQSERLVLAVIIDAANCDYGHLEPAVRETVRVLNAAGLPPTARLQMAADAGYFSGEDLRFAAEERAWIDLLVAPAKDCARERPGGLFGRDDFQKQSNGTVLCPAGRLMRGPTRHDGGRLQYEGVGCATCDLKPRCTTAKKRYISIAPEAEANAAKMRARMNEPGAKERYNRRLATAEPVFSLIEDTMGFRRTSSRFDRTIRAEILLKILAHNVSRLLVGQASFVVFVAIEF
jgi:transposase